MTKRRIPSALFLAAAALLPLAAHLPWLSRPIGVHEQNLGCYFGPFAVSYADYGFAALRGGMVYKTRYEPLNQAVLYNNHPPGAAWSTLPFGSDERGLRTPFVLFGCASSVLFAWLLRRRFSPPVAALCGVAYALSPAVAFDGVATYETATGAFGLALLACADAARSAPTTRRRRYLFGGAEAALVFVGIWFDWSFAWWVWAYAFAQARDGFRSWIARIALPAAGGLLSVGLYLYWRTWAADAPLLGWPRNVGLFDTATSAMVVGGLSMGEYFEGVARQLVDGFTLPVLLVAIPGSIFLFVGGARSALLLLAPAVMHALAFRNHAATHVQFNMWFGVTIFASCAAAADAVFRRLRGAPVLAVAFMAIVATASAYETYRVVRGRDTTFLRDVGRAIDAEAADLSEGFPPKKIWAVAFNLPFAYAYYIQAPYIYAGIVDERSLDATLASLPPDIGLKLILFSGARDEGEGPGIGFTDGLRRRVENFERRPLGELEVSVPLDRRGEKHMTFDDVFVVTVK